MGDTENLGLAFTFLAESPAEVAYDETGLDALVTVRAEDAEVLAPPVRSAEVLIMDRSLSMAEHGKLAEAQRAMAAAVDAVREGTLLGILAGDHEAEVLYPAGGGLAPVDAAARAAAKARIASVLPSGGTRIGAWLRRADRLFATPEATAPGTVRHAVLYTDGIDEHETPEELAGALAACTDHFVCDARGFGEDFDYRELLRVTEALHGEARAVVDPAALTDDFTGIMRRVQHLVVPRVSLRLRPRTGFEVVSVRQTYPVEAALPLRREDGGVVRVPLGAWSAQERHYQVSLAYPPEALNPGDRTRVLRLALHADTGAGDGAGAECADGRHIAVTRLSTPGVGIVPPAGLTHVEDMRELGTAIGDCVDAWVAGDRVRADGLLRRALRLAEDLDDTGRLDALRAVAEQGPDGRRRLREGVARGEMQSLGVLSIHTRRSHQAGEPAGTPPQATARRPCPRCAAPLAPDDGFCGACGLRATGEKP